MNAKIEHGLMAGDQPVALEGVKIDARLSGACVEVTITQRYRNREKTPIEAVYVFPLQESAAVCGFAALVGGELIAGKVEERERAFEQYDDAMMRGDGTFLLDQERPNVFTASVGNLRPNESIELQLKYVALAAREGDAIRLAIPTTVSPRYAPAGTTEVGQPDAERVNPPHWPQVPYGLQLNVEVAAADLKRVESPSHPVRVELRDGGAQVELASDEVALDRDFVLLVERREPRRPEARVAREPDGRRVAMVTFLPELAPAGDQGHELLFLLDCSGSMEGESITQARRALALCVRALNAADTFNVIRFGSHHEALWKTPRRFDQQALDEATRYVEQTHANLGGTDILAPLRALLEAERDPARPRRVLLLTDGQVSNEADVLALARKHQAGTRIFAFGIGAGASEHLVRGAARASRGAAELIFPGERIEPKVLRMFERARTPALDDAAVVWNGLRVEQAPSVLPPLFACDPLTVFARIEDGSASELELRAGGQRWSVAIDLEHAEAGGPIPTLWAREAIRELDDETSPRRGSSQQRPELDDKRRKRLVELGTRYQLLNSATSFVAVAARDANDQTTQPAQLRRIPVALTHGWGGGRHALAVAGGARAPVNLAPSFVGRPAPMAPGAMPASAPMARARFDAVASFAGPARAEAKGRHDTTLGVAARGTAATPAHTRYAPPPPPASVDHLFDVLMTQRADGSFARSAALDAWLGPERSKRLAVALAGSDERVAITALVLHELQRAHADREDEWRPAAAKARAWLATQPAKFDASAF